MISAWLSTFQRRLTNLSGQNKSLLLLRLSSRQDLDLAQLDYLDHAPAFALIAHLIASTAPRPLVPLADDREARLNEVSAYLRRIERTERLVREERGTHDLYVGWPFVHGQMTDGTPVRAPLLLFPVGLTRDAQQWSLARRPEVPIAFNPSLLLAYAHYQGQPVAESLLEETFEQAPTDATAFRSFVYDLLGNSSFTVNFNPATFADRLLPFAAFTREDFARAQRPGVLTVFSEAVLGLFPQAGSFLAPDYQFLLEQEHPPTPEQLFHPAPEVPPAEGREAQTYAVFPLDAAQEHALHQIKAGQSVVVQGPPGTGKSQLIANLMADFTARGKRVLLVCQKRAALDVVYDRLRGLGAADSMALVHDVQYDRGALFAQIARQIERVEENQQRNNSLDGVTLEREFLQLSRQLDQAHAELEDFRTALFDTGRCGLSAKELYLTSDPEAPAVALGTAYRDFRFDAVADFREQLLTYFTYYRHLGPAHPWTDRRSLARLSFADVRPLGDLLRRIPAHNRALTEATSQLWLRPLLLADVAAMAPQVPALRDWLGTLAQGDTFGIWQASMQADHPPADPAQLAEWQSAWHTHWSEAVGQLSLASTDLEDAQRRVAEALRSSRNWLHWQWWQWFSPDREMVSEWVETCAWPLNGQGLAQLADLLARRQQLESLMATLHHTPGAYTLPDALDYPAWQRWFEDTKRAYAAWATVQAQPVFASFFQLTQITAADLVFAAEKLLDAVEDTHTAYQQWQHELTPGQIARLWEDAAWADTLADALALDLEVLVALDQVLATVATPGRAVLQRLQTTTSAAELTQEDTPARLLARFDNGLRLAWLADIEAAYPVLRTVSSPRFAQVERTLQTSLARKRALSADIWHMRLREATYQTLAYNRLGNRTTYRDLYHQVTKKRRRWPLRKLLTEFADELFDLVPCWLASPEAVSALFPMTPLFDLVVFDEASQCFAEQGVPALFRARQVAVLGDDQQLPPNQLYQTRWEDPEGNDEPVLEADSLLRMASHYLPTVHLTEHYRSQLPELIAFSNQHFYQHRLRLLPDFHLLNARQPAIRYHHVEGVWAQRANRAEADEVIRCIWQEWEAQDMAAEGPDLGVVTFNVTQQALITEQVEARLGAEQRPWPPRLFVKNIENVQGDERDLIVFSVGYAPDAQGRLRMQFGSLNAERGENRLNVAITRARRGIHIVSSLWPHELRTDNAQHPGPRLLKEYLQFALDVDRGRFRFQPDPLGTGQTPWLLKNQLRPLHEALAPDLPFADLTVKTYHRYYGLVRTDDDLYHQRRSARDAHAYTPALLADKHWPVLTLYSREFWRQRAQVQQSLEAFVTAQLAVRPPQIS